SEITPRTYAGENLTIRNKKKKLDESDTYSGSSKFRRHPSNAGGRWLKLPNRQLRRVCFGIDYSFTAE
ncbi:hypothetical protein, partial [Thiolapillus sp.]|uniref:hypothetical protein n=1 Tax=Thiolapillus sp. TaxID=2017437 RepID=UPI003AF92ABC